MDRYGGWLLVALSALAGLALLVAVLVRARSPRRDRRYRPGRPFDFAPVWLRSAPDAAVRPGRELVDRAQGPTAAPADSGDTGGASDRW